MRTTEVVEWLHETDITEIKRTAKNLEGYTAKLKATAKDAAKSGDADLAEELLAEIKEKRQLYRMIRGYYDVLFFAYEYFSDSRNPENEINLIPAGTTLEEAPKFHNELCDKLDELIVRPTKKIGWAAPRGSGKSAYLTNIYPTHAVVYRTRHYMMIISETVGMSKSFMEFISTNLKHNAKLREDFGEHLNPNQKLNEQDNDGAFITAFNVKVEAASIGGQLRGSRFKNYRPDLIICDDIESDKNTNTEELRKKNLHWFNSVVEPMGDPKTTALIYMGTLVHGQGLLPNVLSRPEYDSKIYSSILSEPDYPEMWEHFETLLKQVENEDRLLNAESYYYENKEKMDSGVEVLWPSRFSYLDLIKKKIDLGTRAFASEYLNKPSDLENAIFKEEYFEYFDRESLFRPDGSKKYLDIYGFWDIAMGKNKRSDYNAIVIVGREPKTGVIYVLEAWAKKCPPHEALEKSLEFIEGYKPKTFGVETINAQFEFYRQIQVKAAQRGIYGTKIKPVNPTAKKEQRIEALEPLFEQGFIKIQKHQRLLEEMLIQYPSHSHDDLPDCLASTLSLTRLTKARRYYYKPEGL